ncbi:uncharacterized protein LOC133897465 [Phragmites australis]|uniref:uncharacterized protein LOC133897465 n=1 Tax=Phragmites australis TaxID=29695 RepID=UPI002D793DD5|nr:uncharacterized protein LOC133897465 [Phragmites australis]
MLRLHRRRRTRARMAVGVPASEAVGRAAEAIGGGDGGEVPLEIYGKEELPADGVPAVEVEVKREAAAPVERAPAAIAVEGEEEGHDGEDKNEAAVIEEEGEKWLKHYSSTQSILTVGDGDFSFSLALATAFGSGANLVATSLDTYEALRGKYSKAESNIMELKRLGTTVLHGVDAKTMRFHTDLKNKRFDRIVFNFPHAGFKGKEDDMHMINLHKELVWGFFCNARYLLRRYGEIHVTHKIGGVYDRWDLEHLASACSLVLVVNVGFQKEYYPGYNQKRGDSARCDEPFDIGASCTFKFQIGDLKKLKKMNGNRAGSISNLGGSNVHPGHLATDTGPFHPLPPVQEWPRQHFPSPVNTGGMLIPRQPYIVDQWQQPGFPLKSDCVVRAFHQHDTFRPMLSIPGLSLNALPAPAPGGIPSPMGRIPRPNLLAPQEQHWYQQRTIADPLGSDNYSYFAREYQRSQQRNYDLPRQVMPRATSFNYSAFLERRHRDREHAQKQEWLRRMIALYGRQ